MAKKKIRPRQLPKEFRKYFWEYSFDKIKTYPYKQYILARLMNFGNFKVLQWLLNKAPRNRIIDAVKNSRELDAKTKNYWKLIYGC